MKRGTVTEVNVDAAAAHDTEHREQARRGVDDAEPVEHRRAAPQHGQFPSGPRAAVEHREAVLERPQPRGPDGERAGQDQPQVLGRRHRHGRDQPAGLLGRPGVQAPAVRGWVSGQLATQSRGQGGEPGRAQRQRTGGPQADGGPDGRTAQRL
ncbi:hypothetical protein [Nonomuraea turcica]|uniref:hypothetical protein n=1 Tax=Nonomuraea sp. G32 TaxID=3067274 RepID=UPI00273BC63C|nr:hypothetical protein [Nonomuraea sp. G32]MDP4502680.1 hypothetical protein [Nonomuraea sp. G32]